MSIGEFAVGLGKRLAILPFKGGAVVALFVFSLFIVACSDAPSGQPKQLGTAQQKLTLQEWPADPLVVTNSVQIDHRGRFEGNVAVTNAAGAVLAHNAELALEIDS